MGIVRSFDGQSLQLRFPNDSSPGTGPGALAVFDSGRKMGFPPFGLEPARRLGHHVTGHLGFLYTDNVGFIELSLLDGLLERFPTRSVGASNNNGSGGTMTVPLGLGALARIAEGAVKCHPRERDRTPGDRKRSPTNPTPGGPVAEVSYRLALP